MVSRIGGVIKLYGIQGTSRQRDWDFDDVVDGKVEPLPFHSNSLGEIRVFTKQSRETIGQVLPHSLGQLDIEFSWDEKKIYILRF